MNAIISWVAGSKAVAAFNAVQSAMKGWKTHVIAATGLIVAATNVYTQVCDVQGFSGFIDYVRHATSNPDCQTLWLALLAHTGRAAIANMGVQDAGQVGH